MKRHPQTLSLSLTALVFTATFLSGASNASPDPVLGYSGPLVPAENGSWKEYRTIEEKTVLDANPDDKSCRQSAVTPNLRQLMFEHFRYYVDHSKEKVGDEVVSRFAKVMGMTLFESSGVSAVVTDMNFAGSRNSSQLLRADNKKGDPRPGLFSTVSSVNKLMAMVDSPVSSCKRSGKKRKCHDVMKHVQWNNQINFGLLQMSADRLGRSDTGALARDMITDMKKLFVSHPDEVIDRCGTKLMFKDSEADLRNAFRKMQSCTPGATTKAGVQCFGRWAMLCPNYNISLALIAPPAYFQTAKKPAICTKTFRRLLNSSRAGSSAPIKKATESLKKAAPSLIDRVKSLDWNPFAAASLEQGGLPDLGDDESATADSASVDHSDSSGLIDGDLLDQDSSTATAEDESTI